ncbi:MAG: twin-arginine translocation signal domain-containing protein [Anaerolineales bacterium]|nr:twin-arginine translocation signal domain-containing protein [Anaerolineales bacterium]
MKQLVDRAETQDGSQTFIPRRDFLKVAGLLTAALAAALIAGPARKQTVAVVQGIQMYFRWDSYGKISASRDAGETWQLVADFGPEIDINQVRSAPGGLQAEMYYRNFRIQLYSEDGTTWMA